ncbi:MAG: M24 family metallopeptidase, partial [Candidatus Caldarchaeum sp.]|nr:M24 family metallopeptidase [Candidatus Caldarchaeum sp.]MDW8436311.1 M24 family metallopeptidase [Candidatus Caldarchaeum sp.]
GKASETHKKVFDAVLESQNRALDKAASGVAAEEIDRAARKPLEQAGLGRYFIHRTGHGLGLEVHEEPYIREGNKTYLQAGMIFTVEPGVYLPGKFGVRLEDNLVINATNVENTTHLPKTITLPVR